MGGAIRDIDNPAIEKIHCRNSLLTLEERFEKCGFVDHVTFPCATDIAICYSATDSYVELGFDIR